MEKNEFMYDDFSDRLFISSKKDSEKIKGSVSFLNLVIDITTTNRFANFELRKASDWLKSLKINPDILNNLTNATVVCKQCRRGYLVYFILESKDKTERIPYNIQSTIQPLLIQ